MKEFMTKMVPVNLSDRFPFKCRMCGACCQHVRESVPLESLDAFRLAKHLRDKGEKVNGMEDVLAAYAVTQGAVIILIPIRCGSGLKSSECR